MPEVLFIQETSRTSIHGYDLSTINNFFSEISNPLFHLA